MQGYKKPEMFSTPVSIQFIMCTCSGCSSHVVEFPEPFDGIDATTNKQK